jgi:hypothetical protein
MQVLNHEAGFRDSHSFRRECATGNDTGNLGTELALYVMREKDTAADIIEKIASCQRALLKIACHAWRKSCQTGMPRGGVRERSALARQTINTGRKTLTSCTDHGIDEERRKPLPLCLRPAISISVPRPQGLHRGL